MTAKKPMRRTQVMLVRVMVRVRVTLINMKYVCMEIMLYRR